MLGIRVRPHPILDDPSNPDERIITVDNGLSTLTPPSEHETVVLRFQRTRNNHLLIDTLECSDGVSFEVPRRHRLPEPVVRAHWVRSPEGIWYVIDGCDVSPIMSGWLQPFVTELVSDVFKCLGRLLIWEDDVDDESGRLP